MFALARHRHSDRPYWPGFGVGLLMLGSCSVLAFAPGCVCAREKDRIDGVIDAPEGMKTPIGHQAACVVRLRGAYYDISVSRSREQRSAPRFAPKATFTVGDAKLEIVGDDGVPGGFQNGETWSWADGQSAPAELRGFDKVLDGVLKCTDPSAKCRLRNIRVTEQYIPCGAETSLRGEIRGTELVLRRR